MLKAISDATTTMCCCLLIPAEVAVQLSWLLALLCTFYPTFVGASAVANAAASALAAAAADASFRLDMCRRWLKIAVNGLYGTS